MCEDADSLGEGEEDYVEEIECAEEEIDFLLSKGIDIDQVVKLADIREEVEGT